MHLGNVSQPKREVGLAAPAQKGASYQRSIQRGQEAIDTWFKAYVNVWAEDGKGLRRQQSNKFNRRSPEKPDSPREEGEWKDLFKDGSSAIGLCR